MSGSIEDEVALGRIRQRQHALTKAPLSLAADDSKASEITLDAKTCVFLFGKGSAANRDVSRIDVDKNIV